MALGTELFNLATSFDPYGAFKKGQAAPEEYAIAEKQRELQSMALDEQLKEMKQPQQVAQPQLSQMAKSPFPPDTKLYKEDGTETIAGQVAMYTNTANSEKTRMSQLDSSADQLLKQANIFKFSDPEKYANILKKAGDLKSEARRAEEKAKENTDKASKQWLDANTNSLTAVATSKSQKELDDARKAYEEETGAPVPDFIPKRWDKDEIRKALNNPKIPKKVRDSVEKTLQDRKDKEQASIERTLRINKLNAEIRMFPDRAKKLSLDIEKLEAGFESEEGDIQPTAAGSKLPPERQYNVGNLRPSGFTYEGQTGVDKGGFATFDTPEAGIKALQQDIGAKLYKGLNTPQKFIEVYAPPKSKGGDNPDSATNAYVNNVANALGIKPTDKIEDTPENRKILQNAIITQEGIASPSEKRKLIPKSSQFERGRGEQIIGATKELKRSLSIVSNFPMTVSGGVFGTMKSKTGFFDAPLNVAAVALTDEDQRMFNKATSNIGNALAIIEAGGYKPNQTQIDRYSSILAWSPEDTPSTKLFSMADAKAQAIERADVVLANPAIPKEQKKVLKDAIDDLNKSIPFEPEDVTNAKNKGMSIKQYIQEKSGLVKKEETKPSETKRAYIGNEPIIVKDGKWIYEKTGKAVQ